jgi:hypothetical protein
MSTTDQILEERGQIYGDFYEGINLEAQMLELLKERYRGHYGLEMPPIYAAFMSKILMKLSRLSVTPTHVDSWVDIAGYARLIELHFTKGNNNAKSTQIGNEESTTDAHKTEVRKKGGFA